MSVWQTPQPATSTITSSGESSPGAVSVQSNWPLATNVRPLLVTGAEHARCAGRVVVIGSLLTQNSNDRSKTMIQGNLIGGIEDVITITSACDSMAGERAPEDALAVLVFHVQGRITDCISLRHLCRHVNGNYPRTWAGERSLTAEIAENAE